MNHFSPKYCLFLVKLTIINTNQSPQMNDSVTISLMTSSFYYTITMTPPIELDPNLILPTQLRPLPSRIEQQAAVAALKQQPPRPKRQGQIAPRAKATPHSSTNTRRRRRQVVRLSTRQYAHNESPSPAHTPTSRRTRTPPTSPTDSEETDNSSSSAPSFLHNLDSVTRVATLPNTAYFQQPFQCLRIPPTSSDISPQTTQQTASQVAIPYTNQYPFQRLQPSPRPTSPSVTVLCHR